jgi:ABC-type antimicrobial peptide transport system permease subunit
VLRVPTVRMILSGALTPVCLGLAAEAPLSLAASQATRGLLFGITTHAPAAHGIALAVLLVAAVFAAAVPARRAVRADPVTALREA